MSGLIIIAIVMRTTAPTKKTYAPILKRCLRRFRFKSLILLTHLLNIEKFNVNFLDRARSIPFSCFSKFHYASLRFTLIKRNKVFLSFQICRDILNIIPCTKRTCRDLSKSLQKLSKQKKVDDNPCV
jgi:hypothetical protein